MMRDIDKAVQLYNMMANRCETNGLSPRQARVYREMAEFMQSCETAAEAAEKIKNSKYYLAPSAALIQDKLAALEKAARENEMPDVADIYRQKIAEIYADNNAMYESGHATTALNKKTPYLNTISAFANLYTAYLQYCTEHDDSRSELNKQLSELSMPSADFRTLAAMEKFRALIPCSDEGYKDFVEEMPALAEKGIDITQETNMMRTEFDKAWETISAQKNEIIATGQINLATVKNTRVMVISPETKTGTYTFEEVI